MRKTGNARRITVLGATGSIGVSTLDVVSRHPDRYTVHALTANRDVAGLLAQCVRHRPTYAVMVDLEASRHLASQLTAAGIPTRVLGGKAALAEVAEMPETDVVMAAIVGTAGLLPTITAARAGKVVLLANKESLVTAGPVFMEAARANGATLLPIDSEHNAVFQAMPHGYQGRPAQAGIRKILLTASGGPFRTTNRRELSRVTPEQACAHPNWVMGRKISVDSATMMNKGLEVIEAHWLFDVPSAQIEVLVHPESVIHSLVEYVDGSMLAQLGNPDMRTPIAHALGYPDRIDAGTESLDLVKVARLHFEAPDFVKFPCLRLAYDALAAGGQSAIALNAANEIAVGRFLARDISFTDIPILVEDIVRQAERHAATSLEEVIRADGDYRAMAEGWSPRSMVVMSSGIAETGSTTS